MYADVGREPSKVRYEVDLGSETHTNRHEWIGVSPPQSGWGVQSYTLRQKFTRQIGGLIYVCKNNPVII